MSLSITTQTVNRTERAGIPPALSLCLLVLIILGALGAGFAATDGDTAARAAAAAGPDLTRLLRAMAGLKALIALGVAGATLWRMGAPTRPGWFAAYALACAAASAGPGLIWQMAHVGAGALALHGGVVACLVLLWRDPVVGERLQAMLAARRASLR